MCFFTVHLAALKKQLLKLRHQSYRSVSSVNSSPQTLLHLDSGTFSSSSSSPANPRECQSTSSFCSLTCSFTEEQLQGCIIFSSSSNRRWRQEVHRGDVQQVAQQVIGMTATVSREQRVLRWPQGYCIHNII